MKLKFVLLVALLQPVAWGEDGKSTFGEVWRTVGSDAYSQLPQYQVTLGSFFGFFKDYLKAAARRTVTDHSDVLPRFTKLVHPNGICLAGSWNITETSPYTGYFSKGSRGLIIARASVAMTDTVKGKYRAFGLAGKIYPTQDPEHSDRLSTANFFVVDDLGGTLTPHYTESEMTNHPAATGRLASLAIGAAAVRAFGAIDSNPMVRQMYEVSDLGMQDPSQSHTPDYFMVRAAPGQNVDRNDFRNELRLSNHGGRLVFDIFVAGSAQEPWSAIGNIEFTEDAVSDSCDHRLHFHHPKWRANLR